MLNSDYSNGEQFAVCSSNEIKVYDVRSSNTHVGYIQNQKKIDYLSLTSRHNLLACGTELSGVDAELHLYDIRKLSIPVRSFIDSHHDDITCIKFHPNDKNIFMSGSTDGCANIYDLTQPEEDDALHQVIPFSSIHSCNWISPKRISTLSHMETFAIHDLNDKSEILEKPKHPLDFGDVRQVWDCDYVVDIYPGYIATGKSQENNGQLKIIPFQNEKADINNSFVIKNAHNDDVIRDTLINPNNMKKKNNLLYSCGEDGCVKLWDISKQKDAFGHVSDEFFDYSARYNVFEEEEPIPALEKDTTDKMEVDSGNEETVVKCDKDKKMKKKKSKKSSKKHSSKQRFKPY